MDDRVRRLRSRLEACSRGRAPRGVRYPAELRAEVVRLACEAQGAGVRAGALAKQLGLRPDTITGWGGQGSYQRVPRVRIAPVPPAAMASPAVPVLVTPPGWRIEGLDVATILRLLQLGT